MGELSKAYGIRTDDPQDGDGVLMFDQGRLGHIGVYFHLAHEGYVLHSNESNGCSVLHAIRDLPSFGARVEGYYRWV